MTLDEFNRALALGFGVRAPRLVLKHESTQEGLLRAGYKPDEEAIYLWVHTPRKLAHEFGHHLQRMTGEDWPYERTWLEWRFPGEFAAATAVLLREQARGHYDPDVFEEELFARVFERVWHHLLPP